VFKVIDMDESFSDWSFTQLKKLPKSKLQSIAEDIAWKSDVALLATTKEELVSFVCYYGLLP
jgi:hypothetical protein